MLLDDHELPNRPNPTDEAIKIILNITGFAFMALFSIYGLLRFLDDLTRQ